MTPQQNPMPDKAEVDELGKILQHATGGCVCAGDCMYWHSLNEDGVDYEKLQSKAATAIRAAIAGAIPEKQEQTCHCGSEDCGEFYGPLCFNAAIDQITTELKRKGLLLSEIICPNCGEHINPNDPKLEWYED